jgi:alpha-galactosidase
VAVVQFKKFAQLGLAGKQHVRDLWRQKKLLDVDTTSELLPLGIPAHGVLLYKFTEVK